MQFLNPIALWLLILVPIAVVFFRRREMVYLKRLRLVQSRVTESELIRRNRRRLTIWGICTVLVIIALGRPAWGLEIEPVETQGVSVMFVLDVSRSMDAQDVQPSRLERAKLSLEDLLKLLSGNEMGLILFAGNAVLQFPLTTDTVSAADFVRQVSTSSLTEQGTNITDAIQLAMLALKSASKGKHLIVLLTDGEGHEGKPIDAAIAGSQSDITIFSVGYGDAAGTLIPIHNADGSIIDKTDSSGNRVVSALDEATLKSVAEATGGQYIHASADGDEVSRLMELVKQFVPETLNRGVQTKPIEHFDFFLTLAVILLAIEILLPIARPQTA